MLSGVKRYLSQPETGAGLLYAALATWILVGALTSRISSEQFLPLASPVEIAWTAISFAVSAWLAFVLLRRKPRGNALRRILFLALAHAVGAIRFYEPGMALVAALPLFALLPALLLRTPDTK